MSGTIRFSRFASPNEQRTISREDLGLYFSVIIGAVYALPSSLITEHKHSYYAALRQCVTKNPYLSVTVGDVHTRKAYFNDVGTIDLSQHVHILDQSTYCKPDQPESAWIDSVLLAYLDRPWPPSIPPWTLAVLPLGPSRAFLAFAFSHTIGDGATGTAFHRCLLNELENAGLDIAQPKLDIPFAPLPEPFDTAARLPISWSYLLGPLLGEYLPRPIAHALGLGRTAASPDTGTWLGTPVNANVTAANTCLRSFTVPASTVSALLSLARSQQVRLTGLFHQVLVRALSESIPDGAAYDNFLAETAINLRAALQADTDAPGQYISVVFESFSRTRSKSSAFDWNAARGTTNLLAERSKSPQDQAIALLRYLSDIRAWLVAKGGKPRDGSYGLSNLGSFDGRGRIESMIFAQPGPVAGSVFCVNLVSVKNGPLAVTLNWCPGAFGLDAGEEEERFVNRLVSSIQDQLATLTR